MLCFSCKKDKHIKPNYDENYSFFVAGHAYGSPNNFVGGLYSPFVSKFTTLKQNPTLEMGFLTGDIVKYSTSMFWDLADFDVSSINKPVHYVLGNHGASNLPLYKSRYGSTYYSFVKHNDLFIVLDGNIDEWNISGDQLLFLEQTIAEHKAETKNIFIFCHQVFFKDLFNVTTNSDENKSNQLNYITDVLPILKQTNKKVTIFTGDVGAFDWGPAIFYERQKNITYIASGMGGGVQDNFIIVEVDSLKSIQYKLISLIGDEQSLGELEGY